MFAALDAAVAGVAELDMAGLAPAVRLRALERLETSRRLQAAIGHDVIHTLADEDATELGGIFPKVLADTLRISMAESRRRIRDATQLAPRLTLTGQELPPELPATAAAWHEGALDGEHLRVIQQFLRHLPKATPADVVENAEAFLARQARSLRPDQLAQLADRYAIMINPDGTFTDTDRAAQRSFTWSRQRPDGMSEAKLIATPQLRAYLEAWLARYAAPGMCNPDDQTPCTDGQPSDEATRTDLRDVGKRNHDALEVLARSQLGKPQLGTHHGLPVTVIVSTTLHELRAGAGVALTAGGTLIPMRDLIRMASHAYHYLAVFDEHTSRPLYLGRTRRTASPDQWIVLYTRDRGCTAPGCPVPGYHTEAHHMKPWSHGGLTDITNLTLACHPEHQLMDHGWTTQPRPDGTTEWIPPPHLNQPGRTNTYHHPERLLPDDPDDQSA